MGILYSVEDGSAHDSTPPTEDCCKKRQGRRIRLVDGLESAEIGVRQDGQITLTVSMVESVC